MCSDCSCTQYDRAAGPVNEHSMTLTAATLTQLHLQHGSRATSSSGQGPGW